MSRLGLSAALLGGQFGDGLQQAAGQAGQMYAQQAALTPDLLFQGLARAADARLRAAELTAKLQADQAAGLREALSSAIDQYNRSYNAAANRKANATEGGLERASRERIAEADRSMRAEERAADRATQIDVANIGADARRDVAGERSGGLGVSKTLVALNQEKTKAQLDKDLPRAQRAAELETQGWSQVYDAAETPEEQQQVLQQARQMGVRIGPDAPPTPPPSLPKEGRGVFGPGGSLDFGGIGALISPQRGEAYWPQAASGRSWGDYLGDLTYPLRNWLTYPLGGAERSSAPLGPPTLAAPTGEPAPQPGTLEDFYQSIKGLPPPASQPVGLPLTAPQPDPWANYNWLGRR